ncbi:MAG TPA: hypothetical protein VHQ65_00955 [Thermoanaerobaculia bacterium]|nr:hypothetical protein [Thermoanaerobaculia bacterium]
MSSGPAARWWSLRRLGPRRPRRRRILAMLAFRDEMRYLPDWFENVVPHVDGVVALDDGSTDGSGEYVAAHPAVLEVVRRPPREPHVWEDAANHRLLVETGWRHRPDWLLGVDADERLEHDFRRRAEAEIDRAEHEGLTAYNLQVREVWDRPDRVRVDGLWGRKVSPRLFLARRDHQFHEQRLHCYWAPLDSRLPDGRFPDADLFLYHLKMLHPADREARRDRYRALDPDRELQAIGYDYLTDETGLELAPLPTARGYRPWPG